MFTHGSFGAKLFSLLGLLLLVPPAVSAQFSRNESVLEGDKIEEKEGHGLAIRSNPAGAQVYIDGIERGKTPLKLENLRPGSYFIKLTRESYSERSFSVTIRRGSLLDLTVALKEARGKLLVRINPAPESPEYLKIPPDPTINSDAEGELTKQGSGFLLDLPAGFRTVKVRAFGWEEASSVVYLGDGAVETVDFTLKPALFRVERPSLSRRKFNPDNTGSLGSTVINFEVNGPGSGSMSVLNSLGETVFSRELEEFVSWKQSVPWNGRGRRGEALEDGLYSVIINAESIPLDIAPPFATTLALEVELDSSGKIYPLSVSSGKGGLLFSPAAGLLPQGSFQIEGSLLFGSPPLGSEPWRSLPFAAAFRFSPLERLELSGALNAVPVFGEDVRLGLGGSAKWVFSNPGSGNFGAAAGVSLSWLKKAQDESGFSERERPSGNPPSPFGMSSGAELFFPFQFEAGGGFAFILSPSLLWTGGEILPTEIVPRLVISGGPLLRGGFFSAGVSARGEFTLNGNDTPSLAAGAEIKFFPPPSNFVFSVIGGLWTKSSRLGGFGGASIGIIY